MKAKYFNTSKNDPYSYSTNSLSENKENWNSTRTPFTVPLFLFAYIFAPLHFAAHGWRILYGSSSNDVSHVSFKA